MKITKVRTGRFGGVLTAVAIGTVCAVHAETKTLTWNGGTSGVWDLKTANWLDGETATTWIDGSDAYIATDAATITLAHGALSVRKLSVASSVATPPVLVGVGPVTDTESAVADGERGLAWNTYMAGNTDDWTVIWTNRKLSSISGIAYAYINKTADGGAGDGKGYYWRYDAVTDTATVQIQPDLYRTNQMVCTDVAFRQNGANIEARLKGSAYHGANKDDPGYHDRISPMRTDGTLYQVKNFLATTAGSGIRFGSAGGFLRASGMTVAVPVLDGDEDAPDDPAVCGRTADWGKYLTDDWKTIWKNRKLANITGLSYAYTAKTHTYADNTQVCRGYFWNYDAATGTATTQFQPDVFNANQMIGCNVVFRQNGADIDARVTGADFSPSIRQVGTPGYHDRVEMTHSTGASYMSVKEIRAIEGANHLAVDGCGEAQNLSTKLYPSSVDPVVIWKDARLSDLIAVDGRHVSTEGEIANMPVAFANDGTKATVQLQRLCEYQTTEKNGLVTYANLSFTQVGDDIAVRVDSTGFRWFYAENIATDPLVFPDARLPTTGAGGNYYTTPADLKGYFKPVRIQAPIDGIKRPPEFVSSGFEFTGGTTFDFMWPLAVDNAFIPFGFSSGAQAAFPAGLTNQVGTVSFAGATTLALPEGAAFEAVGVMAAAGTIVTIDANIDAKPVRIGTRKCLAGDAKRAFKTSNGMALGQDALGYLVPLAGLVIVVR